MMMLVTPVFAMGAPPQGGSPWLQFVPFVLVLGDLLLHHPPADEAEAAEGPDVSRRPQGRGPDHHHRRASTVRSPRLGEQSLQIQIADKIKIEVARAAIGGYQGQAPVVEPANPQ